DGQADALRDRPAVVIDLQDCDPCTGRLRHTGDKYAHRSTADHDDILTALEASASYVVNRDGGRFDERTVGEIETVGKSDQHLAGYRPELLHRTRRVNAHEVEVLADVPVAGTARRTSAAPAQGHDRHGVAGFPLPHSGAARDDTP